MKILNTYLPIIIVCTLYIQIHEWFCFYLGPESLLDVKYILKQCLEAGLKEQGVYLLTMLGQHLDAMELALSIDIGELYF